MDLKKRLIKITKLRELYEHEKGVNCIIYIPTYDRIVSGSTDHRMIIWDPKNGKIERILHHHRGSVNDLLLVKNDERLVSCSTDKFCVVWDVKVLMEGKDDNNSENRFDEIYANEVSSLNGSLVLEKFDLGGVGTRMEKLDEDLWVCGNHDGVLMFYGLEGGRKFTIFDDTLTPYPINSIYKLKKKSKDGEKNPFICVSSGFKYSSQKNLKLQRTFDVYILNIELRKITKRLKGGHKNIIECISSFEKDGKEIIITGGYDKLVNLWDFSSGNLLYSFRNEGFIKCFAIMRENYLFVGDFTEITKGTVENDDNENYIDSLEEFEGCLTIFDLQNYEKKVNQTIHVNSIRDIAVLNDNQVATCSGDKSIVLLEILFTEETDGEESFEEVVTDQLLEKVKILKNENSELKEANENLMKKISKLKEKYDRSISDKFLIDDSELKINGMIGRGGFGIVHSAIWVERGGGVEVAVKEIKMNDISKKKEVVEEFVICSNLYHPRILRLFGYSVVKEELATFRFVMEKMDMDLSTFITKFRDNLTLLDKLNIMKKMTQGLCYLHNKHIIHSDIKAKNFLLKGVNRKDVNDIDLKISDFGLSQTKSSSSTFVENKSMGTVRWMAPELFNLNAQFSYYSDIYSLGCSFYEVLYGVVPFFGTNNDQIIIYQVLNNGAIPDLKLNKKIPVVLRECLRKCFERVPKKRPLCSILLRQIEEIKELL